MQRDKISLFIDAVEAANSISPQNGSRRGLSGEPQEASRGYFVGWVARP
jgi:hypothetical protein